MFKQVVAPSFDMTQGELELHNSLFTDKFHWRAGRLAGFANLGSSLVVSSHGTAAIEPTNGVALDGTTHDQCWNDALSWCRCCVLKLG